MTLSDPIADLLTRIRNALKAEHRYTDVPYSKFKENITKVLQNESLIEKFTVHQEKGNGYIRIYLKYTKSRKPIINGLKRVSSPGLRKYVNHTEIPQFFGNLGLSIVSTSRGVMSGKQAIQNKIGGELVCLVW